MLDSLDKRPGRYDSAGCLIATHQKNAPWTFKYESII